MLDWSTCPAVERQSGQSQRRVGLQGLGKHSCGGGCVYIKRLSDVHLPTLKKLVKASVRHTKKNG